MRTGAELEEADGGAAWWRERRLRYNRGLAAAGVLALIADGIVFELGPPAPAVPEPAELTLFTLALQAFGYVIAMGLANVCYGLGPLAERMVRPTDPMAFRRATFALGFAFSVALPLTVPAAHLARGFGAI